MTTTSTLTVGGRNVTRGPLDKTAAAAAQIFAQYRLGAPFRDNMARILAQAIIDRVRHALIHQTNPGAARRLSPLTVGAKRAMGAYSPPAPLFDTGRLGMAMYQRKAGAGKAIVSFRGSAGTGSGGKRTAAGVVASAMEFGSSFEVSKRMRNFFIGAVRNDGWPEEFLRIREGTRLQVPARPFFVPTIKTSIPDLEQIATRALMHYITTATPTSVRTF